MPGRRSLLVIVGIVAVLSTGCSRIEIAYRYLGWLVGHYTERYVDLTGEQRGLITREVDDLKRWHCHDSIPGFIQILGDIQSDVRSALPSAERVRWYAEVFESEVGYLVEQAHPGIARLMASLTDAQVEELLSSLEERNREFVERLEKTSVEELAKEYRVSRINDLERWLGDLSDGQLAIVTNWSLAFQPLGYEGLAVRQAWQEELAELLEDRRQPMEQFIPRVGAFLKKHRDDPSGRYRDRLSSNKVETVVMVTSVLALADSVQRTHMDREIGALRNDLQSLVCLPGSTPPLQAMKSP
ncbi:MAG: DUF6279 family lipoprotein [Pseudomonadota bacterium]|nr:DUF6279 family lipoprotein [Pseudomonadota bacterium]